MGPTPAAGATGRVERRTSLMADLMEAITSLAKRRGIVFQSSEIYGGLRSTWDYGPLGVELKRNVKNAWWRAMVQLRDDIVGLDASILMSPRVWEASGHLESFSDPLAECTQCHERWRLDHLPGWEPGKTVAELRCPNDGGSLMDPRQFNLMFKTHMGPIEDEGSVAYLRPETAQAMFVDFVTIQAAARKKIPNGIFLRAAAWIVTKSTNMAWAVSGRRYATDPSSSMGPMWVLNMRLNWRGSMSDT